MLPDGVRLDSSPTKGRFLVATRHFSPGDVVVSQLPYAAVLFSEHISKFCNYCFQRGENLRRCSRSKFAHYCSKEHQLKDWKDGYKYECEFLQQCAPRRPPESTRLAARVVWKRKRELETGVDHSDQWNTYHGVDLLNDHFDDLPSDRLQAFAEMGYFISKLCPNLPEGGFALNETIEKSLARLIAKFAFNNHTISSSSETSLGCGVYPLLAMVNHSSWPNCIQRFNNKLCEFRAISPIKSGDEITITYVDLASTTIERRDILKEAYLFDLLADVSVKKPTRRFQINPELIIEIWKKNQPYWIVCDKDTKLTQVMNKSGVAGGLMVTSKTPDSKLISDLGIRMLNNDSDVQETGDTGPVLVVQLWGNWVTGRIDHGAIGRRVAEIHSLVLQGRQLVDAGEAKHGFFQWQKALILLDQPILGDYYLPKNHILYFKTMDFVAKTAIDIGNEWELALKYAHQVIPVLDVLYPHYWSERGSQFAVLAKLESNFGDLKNAVEASEEAIHILRITDGTSDVLETMRDLSMQLKRELDYTSHVSNSA
eukprot:g5751.t1